MKTNIFSKLFLSVLLFFAVSIPLYVYVFLLQMILSTSFLLYDVGGWMTILFTLIFLLFFLIPFYPMYLLAKYVFSKITLILELDVKYSPLIHSITYIAFILLSYFVYSNMTSEITSLFNENMYVDILSYVILGVLHLISSKIHIFKQKNKL